MAAATKERRGRPTIRDVIARRVLTGPSASRRRYVVRIGRPEPDETIDWRCAYHISGIGMRLPRYAFGVDAFQALILALQAIQVRLETAGVPLHWLGGEAGDLGFPRHVSSSFGVALERRLGRLIDRETLQYSKMLAGKARRRKKRPAR